MKVATALASFLTMTGCGVALVAIAFNALSTDPDTANPVGLVGMALALVGLVGFSLQIAAVVGARRSRRVR